MIAFIRGTVAAYGSDYVVVDHDGMGWKIGYAHTDLIKLNQEIKVFTYLHVTENDMSLFGFESEEEKEFFLKLIAVKGLGPKTAMNMLARTNYRTLIASIEQGDVSMLKSMPGIGAKTASQIILDLKGKLIAAEQKTASYPPEIAEACEALKSLGYKQGDIASAAKFMNETPGLKTEAYLKKGLQYLMKTKNGG